MEKLTMTTFLLNVLLALACVLFGSVVAEVYGGWAGTSSGGLVFIVCGVIQLWLHVRATQDRFEMDMFRGH